ncbi:MAG: hypothetical protein ACK4PI_07015 [Tepidisphaerales bacterium]
MAPTAARCRPGRTHRRLTLLAACLLSLAGRLGAPIHAHAAAAVEPPKPGSDSAVAPPPQVTRDGLPALFDPDRHLRVADVRPGMTGYGLTVFRGTAIERFEVEVIDVLRNFAPGADAVLIMAKGDFLRHSGSIAGMSGSPIYLRCDDGKDRLIGALAFGWRLAKDPVAGVQPIEYMLDVADPQRPRPPAFTPRLPPDAGAAPAARAHGAGAPLWRYQDHLPPPTLPGREKLQWYLRRHGIAAPALSGLDVARGPLTPLGLSVVASGLRTGLLEPDGTGPARTADLLRPLLKLAGVRDLRVSAAARPPADASDGKIEPGSALVIPLLTGDMELAAVGTCTEVLGERVFGFGHPFNGEGGVELPMAAGYIAGVITNLESSFKIGAATAPLGVVRADTVVGVGGTFGGSVPTIPITVDVTYADGSQRETLRFSAAHHPNFIPLFSMLTTLAALQLQHAPPVDHALAYRVEARYADGRTLVLANRLAGSEIVELVGGIALPLHALADSPFGRMFPVSVHTTLEVIPGRFAAELTAARVVPPRLRPGGEARIVLTLLRPDGRTESRSFPWRLPADIEPGTYELTVSDHQTFLAQELEEQPARFFARTQAEQLDVLSRVASVQAGRAYLRLKRGPDGLAVGPASLPRLPATLGRMITAGAGQSGLPAAPTARSDTATFALDMLLTGAQTLQVVVEAEPGRKPRAIRPPSSAPPAVSPTPPPSR